VEIAVAYGGEAGPDLEALADWAGLGAADVIARHSAQTYRVFALGFLPGFAYLGTVDPAIAMPRKPTPRLRVPAGAVGIAGRQTGVYPLSSPGGWQLIGQAGARMFDAAATRPALLTPGDRVRFIPAASLPPLLPPRAHPEAPGAAPAITVVSPGLFTTVQDLGRWGHQAEGVPVAGAMDADAHQTANALVGNRPQAPTLEVTLMGPELRFEAESVVAVAGADLSATLDGTDLPVNTARACRSGAVLRFGARREGARAYLACAGGFEVPPVLGSAATHVMSGLGGLEGRALKAGDRLRLGQCHGGTGLVSGYPPGGNRVAGGARLRVLPGPQDDLFDAAAFETLQRGRYVIAPQSNRMGYRLSGPSLVAPPGDMISDVTFPGAIQVPSSGQPILLMADRQTIGGYPQIATVISADLPLAGQLAPGDWIEFEVCTRGEALSALGQQAGDGG
jgi:biotin-dependent carboxylase-like uncharacterized protein